jgi:hypothetical protein
MLNLPIGKECVNLDYIVPTPNAWWSASSEVHVLAMRNAREIHLDPLSVFLVNAKLSKDQWKLALTTVNVSAVSVLTRSVPRLLFQEKHYQQRLFIALDTSTTSKQSKDACISIVETPVPFSVTFWKDLDLALLLDAISPSRNLQMLLLMNLVFVLATRERLYTFPPRDSLKPPVLLLFRVVPSPLLSSVQNLVQLEVI